MKPVKGILLGLAALIGYNIVAKGSAVKTINFYPEQIHGLEWQRGSLVMDIGIDAHNTSNQQIVMHSISLDINANNYLIGNVSAFDAQTIPANSKTTLQLQGNMKLIGIVQDIMNIMIYHNTTQDINMKGFANLDNFQVPININFKVG